MRKLLYVTCLWFLVTISCARANSPFLAKQKNKAFANLGLGLGLDYGGFGVKLNLNPTKNLGFFIGGGYAIVKPGFNAGVTLRILPDKQFCPFVSGMYGYNAAVKIKGAAKYNKLYYGPSFSIGGELWGKSRTGFWNFELILPVRSQEFNDDWDALKNDPGIKIEQDILPVAFTIGYQFKL
ncbi:MAG TPA: hypothetical protein PKN75_06485 [Bacteroidia bacterium]|nr:hypothetical protein [Bacteroidia bacterium]HNU33222.1 hypothetical protein [Bacteroidia bacterium]